MTYEAIGALLKEGDAINSLVCHSAPGSPLIPGLLLLPHGK